MPRWRGLDPPLGGERARGPAATTTTQGAQPYMFGQPKPLHVRLAGEGGQAAPRKRAHPGRHTQAAGRKSGYGHWEPHNHAPDAARAGDFARLGLGERDREREGEGEPDRLDCMVRTNDTRMGRGPTGRSLHRHTHTMASGEYAASERGRLYALFALELFVTADCDKGMLFARHAHHATRRPWLLWLREGGPRRESPHLPSTYVHPT